MSISSDLKKQITSGDYTLIAQMYAERHALDQRKVTAKYVEMVINGNRAARPGTAANEIIAIAGKYLANKIEIRKAITTCDQI